MAYAREVFWSIVKVLQSVTPLRKYTAERAKLRAERTPIRQPARARTAASRRPRCARPSGFALPPAVRRTAAASAAKLGGKTTAASMSRGHGWVQRALLIQLDEEAERRPGKASTPPRWPAGCFRTAEDGHGTSPPTLTPPRCAALAGLKRDGLATVSYSHETMGGVFKYDSKWTITEAGKARTPRS